MIDYVWFINSTQVDEDTFNRYFYELRLDHEYYTIERIEENGQLKVILRDMSTKSVYDYRT